MLVCVSASARACACVCIRAYVCIGVYVGFAGANVRISVVHIRV